MNEKLKDWLIDVAFRTIKTVAETAVGIITSSGMLMGDINWGLVASASAVSAITCILVNLKGIEPPKK